MPTSKEESADYQRLVRLAFPERPRTALKKWRDNNREWSRELDRKYWREGYAKEPQRYRNKSRRWAMANKDKINIRNRRKYRTNLNFRLALSLRNQLRTALRSSGNISRHRRTIQLLGCSIDSFKIYLESKFQVGMTWQTYGVNGWELDHIIPVSIFDLSKPEHQRACFHFSNIQPMWLSNNRSKQDKVPENFDLDRFVKSSIEGN